MISMDHQNKPHNITIEISHQAHLKFAVQHPYGKETELHKNIAYIEAREPFGIPPSSMMGGFESDILWERAGKKQLMSETIQLDIAFDG